MPAKRLRVEVHCRLNTCPKEVLALPSLQWCRVDQLAQGLSQAVRQAGIDLFGLGDQHFADDAKGSPELGGVKRTDQGSSDPGGDLLREAIYAAALDGGNA